MWTQNWCEFDSEMSTGISYKVEWLLGYHNTFKVEIVMSYTVGSVISGV